MKKYIKPIMDEEELMLEDVIAASGDFGNNSKDDSKVDFGDIF